jgi:hypothetical protein
MQADALLLEALGSQRRVARFDADRRPAADAVKELVAVEDRLHAELGQQLAIEVAGEVEPAHRQDDVGHAVDLDGHSCASLGPSEAGGPKWPSRPPHCKDQGRAMWPRYAVLHAHEREFEG